MQKLNNILLRACKYIIGARDEGYFDAPIYRLNVNEGMMGNGESNG